MPIGDGIVEAVFREIPIVDGVGEDSSTTLTSTCCALRLSSGLHRGHSSLSLDRESEERQKQMKKSRIRKRKYDSALILRL